MANTLILYDGKLSSTERVANSLGMIIGNVCIAEISEAPEEISPYDGFCFIFNFYGALTAGKTRQYLTAHREAMVGRRIALVGMGFSDNGFTKYVVDMEDAVGEGISITGMFISDENQVFESGFQIARIFRAPWNEMDPDKLTEIIDEYIKAHTTLALATAGKGNVRCTPLEYNYQDGVFYIVTEGGLKFRSLLSNDDISAAIFEPYDGSMDHISGLQFSGKAVIVERGSDEYWEVLSQKHVSKEACEKLPVELFIVRIVPLRYEFLCSKFNEDGYDAKQFVNTKFAKQRWEDGVAFAKETVDYEAVARREMAEKAAAAEKAIEENKKSISFTEIQEVRKPYDSSDIEALLREAEEPSDEDQDQLSDLPAELEEGAETDDNMISDEADDLEDLDDDLEDEMDDDFGYEFDDDFEDDDEDEFEDEDDEQDDFEDEYEKEPVREITKASGEIDIEELRRLMEEDENNESSGDYTFADDDEEVEDEYEEDEYEDDEYEDDEYEDRTKRTGGEKKGGFSLKNFFAGAFGRKKTIKEDEYEDDEYEDDDLDEYEEDEYEEDEYAEDEYEDDEYEDEEYEDEEYEDDEYEDEEYEDDEYAEDEYEDDEYEEVESDEYEETETEVPEEEAPETETEVPEEEAPETETEVPEEETLETEPEVPEEEAPETEPEVPEEEALETEPKVPEKETLETEPEVPEEEVPETEPEIPEEETLETEPEVPEEEALEIEPEVPEEEALENGAESDDEDEDQPESVLAYNVQDAIEKIRRNMAGVKAEQSETYEVPEFSKTDIDMTEIEQPEELTLDEDEIAEKYGNGPDIEGDFDVLDEDNTYDLFENETDAEDTVDEQGDEKIKADWEDAEKRVSSFRQIFSYRNEMEDDEAGAEKSGESSDAFAGEDEEFEKLFGFRNTSIYEDDESDLDRGRSYGRTRFDDDDDFEYDDEYSYDDDDVLTDDELDELADDEDEAPERGRKKGGFFSKNPFAGLAGLFGGKKKAGKDDYEEEDAEYDDEDTEYDDYEDEEDAEYDDYEDEEDAEYEDYEDEEDAEYEDYEDEEDAEYDDYEDEEDAEYDDYEDEADAEYEDDDDALPDFDDGVKSSSNPAGNAGKAVESDREDYTGEAVSQSEYEVNEGDFAELNSGDEDEDDGLVVVKETLRDEFLEGDTFEDEDESALEEEEDEDDFDSDEEDEDEFALDDDYEDEDDSVETVKKKTVRKPKRGGFFSGLGKSFSGLIGSSRRKDDDDDDLYDFDDEDDEEEMRGDVIDRLERNFENSIGRSEKYVVPSFDDSYDDLDIPDEGEEEEDDLLPAEDFDIPEIRYTEAESESDADASADRESEDDFEDAGYEDVEYEDDLEDDEYEDEDDEYEDEDDESDIYDELEEDDSFSAPGIRKRAKENKVSGKSGGFISRLKAAFGGMKKQSRKDDDEYEDDEYEDDEYEDDEYEDDEYEDDEYEDDEYEDDEYEDDEYEDDEYEDDEYEDDEYEDDEYEDDEAEPAPAKRPFGKIFMRKKPEKKVRGWNSEPVGKWNDEEEGVFDLDRDIDSVDITNLSDRLVAALDDDMIEEIHPDLDK